MKIKIILFLFIFVLMSSLNLERVNAENEEWRVFENSSGEKMIFNTLNGDSVEFQKKVGSYEYRVVLSEKKSIDIDFSRRRLSFVRFLESTSYYFFY